MIESEWAESEDLYKMIWFLKGKSSDRKWRLFIIACCRRVWHLLTDARSRAAIETAERYIEKMCNDSEREFARQQAKRAMLESPRGADGDAAWASRGELIALALVDEIPATYLMGLFNFKASQKNPTGDNAEQGPQADLLRDLFGPCVFRHIELDPIWLTLTVVNLSSTIYTNQKSELMPILADALEEAGCDDTEIILHCRGADQHVRGCWVIDLILSKEPCNY